MAKGKSFYDFTAWESVPLVIHLPANLAVVFEAGMAAARLGLPVQACPYELVVNRRMWLDGHWAGTQRRPIILNVHEHEQHAP